MYTYIVRYGANYIWLRKTRIERDIRNIYMQNNWSERIKRREIRREVKTFEDNFIYYQQQQNHFIVHPFTPLEIIIFQPTLTNCHLIYLNSNQLN